MPYGFSERKSSLAKVLINFAPNIDPEKKHEGI